MAPGRGDTPVRQAVATGLSRWLDEALWGMRPAAPTCPEPPSTCTSPPGCLPRAACCPLCSRPPSTNGLTALGTAISPPEPHTKRGRYTIMATGLTGGLTKPYKGIRPAALTRPELPTHAPVPLNAAQSSSLHSLPRVFPNLSPVCWKRVWRFWA